MKLQRLFTILLQNCFQAPTSNPLADRSLITDVPLFSTKSAALFQPLSGKNETVSNKKSARLISDAFCQKCVSSDVVY